jgi:hypothetical protein
VRLHGRRQHQRRQDSQQHGGSPHDSLLGPDAPILLPGPADRNLAAARP